MAAAMVAAMVAAMEGRPSVAERAEFLLSNSSRKFQLVAWVLLPFKSRVKKKSGVNRWAWSVGRKRLETWEAHPLQS